MQRAIVNFIFLCVVFTVSVVSAVSQSTNYSQPGPYRAGYRTVTVTRPNSTTFTARLYYPALQAGQNTPLEPAGRPYPAVTFGHGFFQAVSTYQSTLEHLATHGFFVIATNSESGIAPNHQNFANDLRYSLTFLEQENANSTSVLFTGVAVDRFGASGHSMGGGASILATSQDTRIRALANLAAAETNPSAKAAMPLITVPFSLPSGSTDTIVPVAINGQEMYTLGKPPKVLPVIQGGWHCGFQDSNGFGCDSGTITRPQQLAETRRLLTSFFDLYLRRNDNAIISVWGDQLTNSLVTAQRNSGIVLLPEVQTISRMPGGDIRASITIRNLTDTSQSFKIEKAQPPRIAELEPIITPPINPGGEHTVNIIIRRQWRNAAALSSILLAAIRVDDPLTVSFARINLIDTYLARDPRE
ncbi:MAG: alpha/beta hydrolase family protein [Pyrinomonadaceae bacterium]